MRTLATMAHYDPRGRVAPHVRRHVEALAKVAERLIVVSTADLQPEDEDWLRSHAELLRRANFGYDFFSYRAGLLEAGNLEDYDHVVVCNDSFVGPFVDYSDIFAAMDARPVDFWGLTHTTRIAPHVQSFFVCFRDWVVRSQAFTGFWQRMTPLSDRSEVIRRYEVGLSATLTDAGFSSGSYFTEDDEDMRAARRRIWWWAALRAQNVPDEGRRRAFARLAREPWNPCAALADRVLGTARLPIVKIDTLRYDPYSLRSDRLIDACEAAYPDQFAGVREFLDETASMYHQRPSEVLPPPGIGLRPFQRAVRYA